MRGVYDEIAAPAVTAVGPPGAAAVACGSAGTLAAAVRTLRSGGGAVDAAVAAGFAAAVTEPTLSSLGGGGFLLVAEPGQRPVICDFFVDVPGRGLATYDPHVETLSVTFGSGAEQVFHAGWGTVATPGCLPGYLEAHGRWGRLPLSEVLAPAIDCAREGVVLDEVQLEFIRVIGDILRVTPASAALYAAPLAGLPFRNREYADLLELLARGHITGADDRTFAQPIVDAMSAHGGLLTQEDFTAYRPRWRDPIATHHRGAKIWTNPPPSFGGSIILRALAQTPSCDSPALLWPAVMTALREATDLQRQSDRADGGSHITRGTTHVSVIDQQGCVAALSMSNGSGSGVAIEGISFNNMLGEEDLNPDGLHCLPAGQRMGSMMSPTMMLGADGSLTAAGTGGSERIRSALVDVIIRTLDLRMPLADAVGAPRLHAATDVTDIEPGLASDVVRALAHQHIPLRQWPSADLFFGGVHAVRRAPDGSVEAIGDSRRGGSVAIVS